MHINRLGYSTDNCPGIYIAKITYALQVHIDLRSKLHCWIINYSHKDCMTFTKPVVVCLSLQSCKVPHRIVHFVWKIMVLIFCCHAVCHECWQEFQSLKSLKAYDIFPCLLYLIIFPVSMENDIPHTASTICLCCSLYMQGWVTLTNALPVFSISHAVLDGSEWVDGNGRTSLVIPGWSYAEEGKLSHHPLWAEQLAVPMEMPQISLFLYFSVFLFCFLCPRWFFRILNLSTWCCLFPFRFLPPHLSCLSFSYSFSFHPSLWDNIHRTCKR